MNTVRVLIVNLALSALAIVFAALTFRLDPLWSQPLPGALLLVGLPLAVSGAALMLAAAYTLWRHGGATGAPGDPTSTLAKTGPYGWTRNPIYGGGALLLMGIALLTRSATFLVLSLLFMPCIDLFVRLVEEPRTERRLGDEYVEYKKSVPRWIPALRRRVRGPGAGGHGPSPVEASGHGKEAPGVSKDEVRRELDYPRKERELAKFLESQDNAVMVLATSHNDRVTARNVLIASDGLALYFFTWEHSRKCVQIRKNPRVALCKDDVQIEGVAEILGGLLDEDIRDYAGILRAKFPDAVERWESRPGMVVVRVRPTLAITAGETIDDCVYRHYIDLQNETAYAERWAHY